MDAPTYSSKQVAEMLAVVAAPPAEDRTLVGGRFQLGFSQHRGQSSAIFRLEFARIGRNATADQPFEQLVDLSPARIVYVACDPVALARDLGTFAAHGYTTPAVRAFDLFPHSHHVEAIAVLTR